jgi:ribosomal protein S14
MGVCNRISRHTQWKLLDHYRRSFFVKYEIKNKVLKSISKNRYLPLSYRYYSLFHKAQIPSIASITKHRNRCLQSGRQYNVLRKTQTCRFVFRFEAYEGVMPGVRRDS